MQFSFDPFAGGDVGEGDDGAYDVVIIADGVRGVLSVEARAVAAPEHFVVGAFAAAVAEGFEDAAVVDRHEGAVGVGVVDEVVHVAAHQLVRGVAEHVGAGAVDEDAAAAQVNAVDAFAGGFQQHFKLTTPGCVMR